MSYIWPYFLNNISNKKKLDNDYKRLSTYVDNLSKSSEGKIQSVKRHILIVKNEFKIFPKRILEVSLMNSFKHLEKRGHRIVKFF